MFVEQLKNETAAIEYLEVEFDSWKGHVKYLIGPYWIHMWEALCWLFL